MGATTRLAAGGNCLLGCWLIAAAIVLETPAVGRWNGLLVGTAIAAIAGYNYVGDGDQPTSAIAAGFVALLGCWLVVAPFALGLEGAARWNDVVAGTLVTAFGSYGAYVAAVTDRAPSFRATAK